MLQSLPGMHKSLVFYGRMSSHCYLFRMKQEHNNDLFLNLSSVTWSFRSHCAFLMVKPSGICLAEKHPLSFLVANNAKISHFSMDGASVALLNFSKYFKMELCLPLDFKNDGFRNKHFTFHSYVLIFFQFTDWFRISRLFFKSRKIIVLLLCLE